MPLIETFAEKVAVYQQQFPTKVVFAGFLLLGGFTEEAQVFCLTRGDSDGGTGGTFLEKTLFQYAI